MPEQKKIMPGNSNWRERLSLIDLLAQKDYLLQLSQVLFWSAFTNLQNLTQKDSLLQLSQVSFWSAFTNLENLTTIQELIYEQKNHAREL